LESVINSRSLIEAVAFETWNTVLKVFMVEKEGRYASTAKNTTATGAPKSMADLALKGLPIARPASDILTITVRTISIALKRGNSRTAAKI
jgi:hypothetical protein